MGPTKAKVTKQKAVSPFTSIAKRTKSAGSKRLATTKNQSSNVHQAFSQKLDALLKVFTDLSTCVTAYEGIQKQGEASVTPSPPISPPGRRARHQGASTPYTEVPQEVSR